MVETAKSTFAPTAARAVRSVQVVAWMIVNPQYPCPFEKWADDLCSPLYRRHRPQETAHAPMDREIFGHEFFSSDGKSVWYDLQTPRSTKFWLAGVDMATGTRIRYKVEREQWSVHYNQSPNGKLFAGDGGGPKSVAARPLDGSALKGPRNGQWIYLFTPQDRYETIKIGGEDVKVGTFDVEKLVDLKNHDYALEPNVRFTPDNRWVVFRSNMHGLTHVYAVEVKKSK